MWTRQQLLQQEQQLQPRLQFGLRGSGAWLEWSRQHLLQQHQVQPKQLGLQLWALPELLLQRFYSSSNSSSIAPCGIFRQWFSTMSCCQPAALLTAVF
jgi:hypothetical protein